jgi:nitroreductase
MDIYEAIKGRESVPSFKPDAVPKESVERALEAATWAPNRFLTEPWRFWVLTEEGRRPLSNLLVELEKETMENPDTEENQKRLRMRQEQPFTVPVIIIVGCEVSDRPRVVPGEELGAVYACTQNLLLALHAEGLEGYWKTPSIIYSNKFKEFLGLKEKDYVLGFFHVGYPETRKKERKRTHYSQKTKWISENESYNK